MANLHFEYQLVRSARRTQLCLQIKGEQVRVLAPSRMPLAAIETFLVAKSAWVTNKLARQKEKAIEQSERTAQQRLLIGGQDCQVIFSRDSQSSVTLNDNQLYVVTSNRVQAHNVSDYRNEQIRQWLIDRATSTLPQKLHAWSQKTGLKPRSLQIKQYKSRWGSCSAKGLISLNSLLMMPPAFVVDYVIVHELCHLKHMNHSSAFWQLVKQHYPGADQAKQWLKKNTVLLNYEF